MHLHLIDAHAHLDFPQFDNDREAIIQRAGKAGIVAIVNAGVDLPSSRAAIALAEQYDCVYATVGVHPHDAKTVTSHTLDTLRTLARHPKVVAIGEIGLDYYRDLSPRSVQRRAFVAQLELASELGLPVVIHDRDAHDDVLMTLQSWSGRGVIHSYSAGPERLDEVLALGFYIGISGPVTFPKAERLRAVAAQVPPERLLVETDCPYLTPAPHRGKRNEPAYVRYVAEQIAVAQQIAPRDVARTTTQNAQRLFGLPVAGA